jgi:hypothetical protein
MFFVAGSAMAGKPREGVDGPYYGNGYPSGKHYNLNIIGKHDGFMGPCPYPKPIFDEFNVFTNEYKYGKVIFIPELTDGITPRIIMQSGKKNGRGSKNIDLNSLETLIVTDPCTQPFLDSLADGEGIGGTVDGLCDNNYEDTTDPAVLQLPPHEPGYDVYIRAHGKPTSDPEDPSDLQITPGLLFVEDGDGHILYYAGTVTKDTLISPNGITRYRGKTETRDITEMFEFTGRICCYGTFEECGSYGGSQIIYWLPVLIDSTDYCFLDVNGNTEYDEDLGEPKEIKDGDCPDPITVYCNEYAGEWIFNIADFVEYFWDIDYNHGVKLVQVRFYPRPAE